MKPHTKLRCVFFVLLPDLTEIRWKPVPPIRSDLVRHCHPLTKIRYDTNPEFEDVDSRAKSKINLKITYNPCRSDIFQFYHHCISASDAISVYFLTVAAFVVSKIYFNWIFRIPFSFQICNSINQIQTKEEAKDEKLELGKVEWGHQKITFLDVVCF